jgi:ribosomal protein S6
MPRFGGAFFTHESMTTTAIIPEVVGLETTVLEESPMTESEEKELVVVKTAIQTAYADKLERDLAIGAGLLQIFRRKLYRGKDGGRTWEQWLAEESAELTSGRGALGKDTANRLRGFYQFRCEILQRDAGRRQSLPLPASPYQIRPLLGQLDTHPEAAIEMWKAAVADAKGKVPTFDQVNRAALAYKANDENDARRLTAAQQAAGDRGRATQAASRAASTNDSVKPRMFLNNEATWPTDMKREVYEARDYSPKPESVAAPSIPAWELERTDDSALDAVEECKKISRAINESHKAIGLLRGILYSQINKHGRDYLGFLRQVDAGVYSLHNIDSQIEQMGC